MPRKEIVYMISFKKFIKIIVNILTKEPFLLNNLKTT